MLHNPSVESFTLPKSLYNVEKILEDSKVLTSENIKMLQELKDLTYLADQVKFLNRNKILNTETFACLLKASPNHRQDVSLSLFFIYSINDKDNYLLLVQYPEYALLFSGWLCILHNGYIYNKLNREKVIEGILNIFLTDQEADEFRDEIVKIKSYKQDPLEDTPEIYKIKCQNFFDRIYNNHRELHISSIKKQIADQDLFSRNSHPTEHNILPEEKGNQYREQTLLTNIVLDYLFFRPKANQSEKPKAQEKGFSVKL